MKNCVNSMIKEVVLTNSICGILVTSIVYYLVGFQALFFFIGLISSILTFMINAFTAQKSLCGNKCNGFIYLVGLAVRILIIAISAVYIIKINEKSIIFYIVGYTFQFIGLLFYSRKIFTT